MKSSDVSYFCSNHAVIPFFGEGAVYPGGNPLPGDRGPRTPSFVSPSLVLNAVPAEGVRLLFNDGFGSPVNELSSYPRVLLGLARGEKRVELITVQENIIVGNFCVRT